MRRDVRSAEAGLKYFVLGALASGILLYGISLVYGFSGTTLFSSIATAYGAGRSLGLTFGLVFVFAGLAFKMSAVPFHMWTPDVYEGAPTPVTAFFASAPKVAAIGLAVRVAVEAMGPADQQCRLRADRSCRRYAGRRGGSAVLPYGLCRDDAGQLHRGAADEG
jgi:NADH-quinone oxidoreductase subunit N